MKSYYDYDEEINLTIVIRRGELENFQIVPEIIPCQGNPLVN